MIDVSPYQFETILTILRKHVPECEVRAFGSRVTWTAKDHSDLDLVIVGQEKLSLKTIAMLKDSFQESDLPFRVDVLDWNAISKEFKGVIEKKYEVIQKAVGIDKKQGKTQACFLRRPLCKIAELVKEGYKHTDVGDFIYIGLEHINQQSLSLNSVGHSSEVASNKFFFRTGDILFGKLRPYFRKVYRPSFDGVCSTDIWVVRAKEGIDQGYLFYLMASPEFVDLASSGSSGTRMPRADWGHLKNTEWPAPPIEQQRSIGKILSDLDAKIELNQKMNKTLETMAQALFKRWFVDFEFPDAQGRPYKSSGGKIVDLELGTIPFGWAMVPLTDIVDVLGGGTPSTPVSSYWNGSIPFFTPKDVAESSYAIKTEKTITQEGLDHCNSALFPRDTVFITDRGTVGKVCMAGVPMAMNQSCYALKGKGLSQFFVFLLIKDTAQKLMQQSHGTVFETITTQTFQRTVAIKPTETIVNLFHREVASLYDQLLCNMKGSATLEDTRDYLLPKLVTGER